MTLTVQDISSLATIGGTALALIAFWIKLSNDIAKADAKAEAAALAAATATTLANTLIAKIEFQTQQLNDYKVEAAEKFLTSKELIESENRMTQALTDLRKDVREMGTRFDRFLEKLIAREQRAA